VKFVPVTTTDVLWNPEAGLTPVTVGAEGNVYVNWSSGLTGVVPPGVVTVTSTTPEPVGAVAKMVFASPMANVAALAPKLTALAPVKFDPVMVTRVPIGPEVGLTPLTAGGGGATYVNWSAALTALVPPGVVIVTSTSPSGPVGAVTVADVGLTTLKKIAGLVAPKLIADAPANPVPVRVTVVPPVLVPEAGLTPVIVGTGGTT
jgi:hypothetical protein